MAGLLDLDDDSSDNPQGGLLALINAPSQPPAVDPYAAALAGQGGMQAARANYARNMALALPSVARAGGSVADMMAAPAAAASQGYSQDVQQAIKDASLLRQMTLAQTLMPMMVQSLQNGGQGGQGGGGGMGQGMVNAGALGSMFGMPGAQQLIDAGKTSLQYDPKTAQALEAAKNSINVDLGLSQQAYNKGDIATARMYYNKAMVDAKQLNISERNNSVMYFPGGMGANGMPNMRSFNPVEGLNSQNGQVSAAPGYTGAEQAINAARAKGEAFKVPQQVINPANGQASVTSLGAALGYGGGGGPAAPGAPGAPSAGGQPGAPTAPGGGPLTALGPAQEEMFKAQGEQANTANEGYQKDAEAANDMIVQINALRGAAADFTPGRFADSRGKFLDYLNSTGLITNDEKRNLGSYQEGAKLGIQLQAAATKQLGSREAAQVFQFMGKSMPNLTMSQDGLERVSSFMEGIARYKAARAEYSQNAFNKGDYQTVNNTRNAFIAGSNPLFYVMASASPNVRNEMLQAMPVQRRNLFLAQWAQAVKGGLAPTPQGIYGE